MAVMARHRSRAATVDDLHTAARSMPHVTEANDDPDRPIYQVGGKSFVFFRTPRPDAVDESGHRYDDVVVLWVPSEADKQALVQDPRSPFFTTAHFDGHPSVLLRTSRIGEISVDELTEIVTDAWLSRASARRARDWLAAHGDT
ncbi:MAG: MmcQ/YjbR family DNA-binding protein [Gordonia polyisoprenivorans]|nr:MmcQ/YjbR family DNA-binding protein [Gordonia polyisoprenivorans]